MAELKWNVILVGEQNVGKTSMSIRFAKNTFMEKYSATVAVDHVSKVLQIHGTQINLQIWDSAGQECYKSIVPQYFRIAQGCILVYDVTDVTTFHKLSWWLSEFRTFNENSPVIIVGNKSDDSTCKAVNRSTIKSFAEQEEMTFMECSAKTGDGVDTVFECLVQKMWENTYPETVVANTSEENSSKSLENNLIHKTDKLEDSPVKIQRYKVQPIPSNSKVENFEEEKKEIIHLSKPPLKPKKKKCCKFL